METQGSHPYNQRPQTRFDAQHDAMGIVGTDWHSLRSLFHLLPILRGCVGCGHARRNYKDLYATQLPFAIKHNVCLCTGIKSERFLSFQREISWRPSFI